MKKVIGVLAVVMFILSVMAIGKAVAYEQITAKEAYDMVDSGTAYLVDIRTTAEYVWVGTCVLPDGTTPYNIPWKIWAYKFVDAGDGKVKAGGITVKGLFLALIKRTFPKGSTLILMCRSGHRTTDAAKFLETVLGEGYYTIYEIDNYLKEEDNGKGGSGGFQGSSKVDPNKNGYRGYPGRLDWCPSPVPTSTSLKSVHPGHPCVALYSSDIGDPDDSVSWMDTGLPMTQKVNKDRIWLYMWRAH